MKKLTVITALFLYGVWRWYAATVTVTQYAPKPVYTPSATPAPVIVDTTKAQPINRVVRHSEPTPLPTPTAVSFAPIPTLHSTYVPLPVATPNPTCVPTSVTGPDGCTFK